MKILILIGLVLIPISCLSQGRNDPKIDSLKNEINVLTDDTTKCNKLIELGNVYLYSRGEDEATQYGNEALELAEELNYSKGIGFAHKLLGISYAYEDDYFEADNHFKSALKAFEHINFKDGISSVLNNLGSVNFALGNDKKSIEYHLLSLKISEETTNKFRIMTNLNNIGTVFSNADSTVDKALYYFRKALTISKEIKYVDGIANVCLNVGEIYFNKGNYDSALAYFKTSSELYNGTPDASYPLSYVGKIYAKRGDFETAFNYHSKAIETSEKFGPKQYLAQSLLSLAQSQKLKGDRFGSINTCKKAQSISEEITARIEMKTAYEMLAQTYADVGDFRNAYKYQMLLTSIRDSLNRIDESRSTQHLQLNFDINEKERLAKEMTLKELQEQREQTLVIQRQKVITAATLISLLLVVIVAALTLRFFQIRKVKRLIEGEKSISEKLLLNILPKEVADELKTKGESQARNFEDVTVLFTDFKDFTSVAERLSAQDLVSEINTCFKAFDQIISKYGIEKIKTIGDSYMAAGGLGSSPTSTRDVVNAAIEMQGFMLDRAEELRKQDNTYFEMRAGIHTGPVVAGIVGVKKFQYDIWGDTVNTASRMESSGRVGKVNISQHTYDIIKIDNDFKFESRGKVEAKNLGLIEMYFVNKI